ncbi:MAG: hypothetical protein KAS32_25740 [Candidatus Peribacteraceae bacterium]|nr:hypothetical protein [Candidatus Peribacteraceae bacterium]
MKKIIILVLLIGFAFSQETFSTITVKPPVELQQLDITLRQIQYTYRDTIGGVPVEEINITYKADYTVYLYDEDGKRVKSTATKGNLIPFLTPAQTTGLRGLLNSIVAKAENQLIP